MKDMKESYRSIGGEGAQKFRSAGVGLRIETLQSEDLSEEVGKGGVKCVGGKKVVEEKTTWRTSCSSPEKVTGGCDSAWDEIGLRLL